MKNKTYTLLIAVLLSLSCYAQDYGAIRSRLEAIADSSLTVRKNVMPTFKKYGAASPQMDSLNALIIRHDSASLEEVRRILDEHGWVGVSKVGEKANSALFLAIQHAQDGKLRERYFPLLEESAKKGESRLADMATMKDRMLVERGGKQLYGTQYRLANGKKELLPVENAKELNKRRKKVGLEEIGLPAGSPE